MAKWPIKPTKIWEAYKEAVLEVDRTVGLVFTGDPALVERAAQEMIAEVEPDSESVRAPQSGGPSQGLNVTVHFVQPEEEEEAAVFLEKSGPSLWVLAVDDGPAFSGEVVQLASGALRVSFSDTPEGWISVRAAVMDLVDEAVVPLARRYPAFRPEVSREVIERTARQNGVIGAAFFLPGADMPVMTLNQIKMIFSLAVIHGQEISEDRVLELGGALGAGFGFRAIARQIGSFVPGPGWIYKGMVGYSGTKALGQAALRYLRSGAVLTPERLLSEVRRLKR